MNPSQFNLSQLDQIRLWGQPIALADWGVLTITGKDAKVWLQRQLTQDIENLPPDGLPIARLDRSARVVYYGILLPREDGFQLVLPRALEVAVREDVDKFVIMEELYLGEQLRTGAVFQVGPGTGIPFNFFGELGHLRFNETAIDVAEYFSLSGIPRWGIDVTGSELINETRLNDLAVDYDKGCFLGQETAAKIRSRRGANYGPVVLSGRGPVPKLGPLTSEQQKVGQLIDVFPVSDGWIANAKLKREWRVIGGHYEFTDEADKVFSAQVQAYPYFQDHSNSAKAQRLYLEGVREFERDRIDEALKKLQRALEFDATLSDVYEAIGVIHSRMGQHQATIEWMDKLLAINPQSVMAHTNKSLAYMNLGQIEKAEAEKAEATVKSFAMYGEEAKSKRAQKEAKEKELADLLRREDMFKQVLAIDEHDLVALFGLADIAFKREQYPQAMELVERAVASNPKHSQSLLLKGKTLEKLGRREEAAEVYRHGIKIASALGELMPANEMQSRLSSLN